MKKIFLLLGIAAAALVSCAKFDDVALWNKSMDMESRIVTLEELCEQMNTNITSLQVLVTAMQENDYITSVTPVYQGDMVIGYTISFFKSEPVTIYHGKDGNTPQIGVKQDTDGHYYWTLDGDWLLGVDGQKILAEGTPGQNGSDGKDGQNGADGKDGITPRFKIENGDWWISTDNGETWQNLGRATCENCNDGQNGEGGDSIFSSVDTDNPNFVIFILADGTEFKVPRYSALSIEFDVEGPVTLLPHSNLKIGYTIITEETSNLSIEAISSADLKVAVSKTTETTGTLDIISGESVDEFSRILVLVSNGEKTIMKSISFGETSGLRVTNGLVREVPAAGEDVEIKVESQMEYVVSIPESDKGWISHVSTRAWRQESIILTVAENKGGQRSSLIDLKDETGRVQQSVRIIQSAGVSGSDPENLTKIYYKSTDGQIVRLWKEDAFDANIISNTYVDNQGIIEFDNVVTSIGDFAFSATYLQQITIPDSVTSIGENAFFGCTGLQQITLPDNLISIGKQAFSLCSSLQAITIPDSVTSIGEMAFNYCTGLQKATIAAASIGESAFYQCTNLQEITLLDSVTSIGRFAFSKCTKLQEITIPDSVASIGEQAFSSCTSLKKTTIAAASIGESVFFECTNLQEIILLDSVASIGRSAFSNCTKLQEITIPAASIGYRAFSGCTGLQEITLLDSVTSIGENAFFQCTNLQEITIPDSVTNIERGAFSQCSSLKKTTIAAASIGEYAFSNCTSLQ